MLFFGLVLQGRGEKTGKIEPIDEGSYTDFALNLNELRCTKCPGLSHSRPSINKSSFLLVQRDQWGLT